MKFCIFVIFVCVQTALPLAQGQSIRDRIDEFIQNLKNLIPDPVEVSDVGFALPENEYLSGSINITNWTISGLRDFSVDVDYSGIIIPIPTGFTLTIDDLDTYKDVLSNLEVYNANTSILNYDTEASLRTVLSDLVVKVELDFTAIPLSVSVTSIWYNIGGLQFDIQGIISDRFSSVLSIILSNTVANILNLVQEPVSELLVDIINSIISGIANEVNDSNSESVYAATSQEKGVENVAKFLEMLENRLGLRS